MQKFKMSLDQISYILTGLVIALAGYFLYKGFYLHKHSNEMAFYILSVLVVAAYLLQPISVDNDRVNINRKVLTETISYREIKTVRLLQDSELLAAIRFFGNGGLFGYTGFYYNKRLGVTRWYCTQRKNYVLIEKTNKKKIIITPDDPEGFLKAIKLMSPSII
jgi:hypothetical protein